MKPTPLAALAGCGLLLAACQHLTPTASPPAGPAPAAPASPAPAQPPAPRPAPPPPVRASCVPKTLPHAPKYPDTDAALLDAGGAADRYQLMAAGRLLRIKRLAELERVIDGCR